jgi:hypothetical protein
MEQLCSMNEITLTQVHRKKILVHFLCCECRSNKNEVQHLQSNPPFFAQYAIPFLVLNSILI